MNATTTTSELELEYQKYVRDYLARNPGSDETEAAVSWGYLVYIRERHAGEA